jgi:hypothetical protein
MNKTSNSPAAVRAPSPPQVPLAPRPNFAARRWTRTAGKPILLGSSWGMAGQTRARG